MVCSPRACERSREGSEVKEGSMASSGMPSGAACTAGVHGDGELEFVGSELTRLARAPRREKKNTVR